MSIYPNPANGTFNVTFDSGLDTNTVNVEVFNTLGQKVKNVTFNNSGNFNERINVSDLSSGIYLVKIGNASRSSTRKLVIS